MNLLQQRLFHSNEGTISVLYLVEDNGLKFLCWIIEDQPQQVKIKHETRIPAGIYELKLREYGRLHDRYKFIFSSFHKGMIEFKNVPGFTDILFHLGNTDDDTSGCILPGTNVIKTVAGEYMLTESTKAYEYVYPLIANELEQGFGVIWEIRDENYLLK